VEVKTCLVNWVRTFELGDDTAKDGIASICGWLLARDQRIRGHDEAPYFVDEIADVVRRLRRTIDLRPEMVYLGVCERIVEHYADEEGDCHPIPCGHQMYARKRDESYDCTGEPGFYCGKVYNVAARQEYLRGLARQQSATVGLCAQVLGMFGMPVKVDTIWNWTRPREIRGVVYPPKVWATGTNDKGENLYKVGDIEELIREATEKKAMRESVAKPA
jgi:hypothetical protein